MTYPSYNVLLYLLSPIIWLYFGYRGLKDRRYWQGLWQRLGFVDNLAVDRPIHLHCASVGEAIAAIPLIKQLTIDYPEYHLLLTTTTPTGKAEIANIIKQLQLNHAYCCYLPIDWRGAVNRFIRKLQPSVSILMETEIWPNLTRQLKVNNIAVVLANARLSEKSLAGYLKRASFSKSLFANLTLVAAQYASDRERFLSVGLNQQQVQIVGSTKFDIQLTPSTLSEQLKFRQLVANDRPCWIAASIHPDEFDAILNCHRKLLETIPNLLLIAVPRHPEAFPVFKTACKSIALDFASRSSLQTPTAETSVLVGDTMGEMLLLCGAADVAFVGGSLIPRGGHNPLEPAVCGIPVAMGSSCYNFSDVCEILQSHDLLTQVDSAQQLADYIVSCLSNQTKLQKIKMLSQQVFKENRGSAEKISKSLAGFFAKP